MGTTSALLQRLYQCADRGLALMLLLLLLRVVCRAPLCRKMIVVEGVYANSGDIAPLQQLYRLKEAFKCVLPVLQAAVPPCNPAGHTGPLVSFAWLQCGSRSLTYLQYSLSLALCMLTTTEGIDPQPQPICCCCCCCCCGTIPDLLWHQPPTSTHLLLHVVCLLLRRYRLCVEESYALGVLGATGRGACEAAGLQPGQVEVIVASMGTTLASVGGFCVGHHEVRGVCGRFCVVTPWLHRGLNTQYGDNARRQSRERVV
jgi:hypothetical protein